MKRSTIPLAIMFVVVPLLAGDDWTSGGTEVGATRAPSEIAEEHPALYTDDLIQEETVVGTPLSEVATMSDTSLETVVSDTAAVLPTRAEGISVSVSDTAVVLPDTIQEVIVPDTTVIEETSTVAVTDTSIVDTAHPPVLKEIPPTLDAGYKGFGWGMPENQMSYYIQFDTLVPSGREDVVSFWGSLGEDTVKYNYYFSDGGFWKVRIDFQVQKTELEDYINHFERIEKFLAKRYGSPKRTSHHDLGTKKEYWLSSFPKISRAYYRSSWQIDSVSVELLLDARTAMPYELAPVFDDLTSDLFLIYYNPSHYEVARPDTSRIPEEAILEAY